MRMFFGPAALAVAALGAVLSGPAMAQGGDLGRLLQEGGILPRRGPDPREQAERDRAIYDQGRRDEEGRREEFRRREAERDERRFEGRRGDERRRGDEDRRRYDDRGPRRE